MNARCPSYVAIDRPSHLGMEVNRLIEFSNVNEHNFPSVLRRTLVFRIESRFVEGAYLDTKLKEGPKCGVFARDPSLREFLVGGSVNVAWALLHGIAAARRSDLVSNSKRLAAETVDRPANHTPDRDSIVWLP